MGSHRWTWGLRIQVILIFGFGQSILVYQGHIQAHFGWSSPLRNGKVGHGLTQLDPRERGQLEQYIAETTEGLSRNDVCKLFGCSNEAYTYVALGLGHADLHVTIAYLPTCFPLEENRLRRRLNEILDQWRDVLPHQRAQAIIRLTTISLSCTSTCVMYEYEYEYEYEC